MRYTLKQLAVFEAVAAYQSVSSAAERLALTQSATSMSLAQLERLLGKPLFERQGKCMCLTHWGRWLRPRAQKLLRDAQQIELGFAGQHLISGELSLGSSQTAAEHLLPQLISNIGSDFPELRIQLGVENTNRVIQGVLNYEFELGIIEGRCDDSRIHQEVWLKDHLVIVASANHPYSTSKQTSLTQLAHARWVLREQGAGTRAIFEAAIHGRIENLDVWREYESVPILCALVRNGAFLSCLPYFDVADAVNKGELVVLNVPELNMARTLSFIWRDDVTENPLRECLINEAKHLVSSQRIAKHPMA